MSGVDAANRHSLAARGEVGARMGIDYSVTGTHVSRALLPRDQPAAAGRFVRYLNGEAELE